MAMFGLCGVALFMSVLVGALSIVLWWGERMK